jgi:hypothetical protein
MTTRATIPIHTTLLLLLFSSCAGQSIDTDTPSLIDKKGNYLFYFHGLVVTYKGDNAINDGAPEWGPYEYSYILDSLSKHGYHVISEIRKEQIHDSVYVNKTVAQVKALLKAGVNPKQIVLVGASAGWFYVLHTSALLKNDQIKFVVIGGCWPDTYKEYSNLDVYGEFLSIIEKSDPHKTCEAIFNNRKSIRSFKEIELNTGRSHGFFYKGWKHWIDPIVKWQQLEK